MRLPIEESRSVTIVMVQLEAVVVAIEDRVESCYVKEEEHGWEFTLCKAIVMVLGRGRVIHTAL